MLRLQILIIIFGLSIGTQSIKSNLSSTFDKFSLIKEFNTTFSEDFENFEILGDAFLLTPELIKKYGYEATKHTVQTQDGYLLEMHRIPKPGAQPILLVHGLLDSSATWVLMGPNRGLGYLLSDLGYDVWLGNVRGNRYSRRHTTLSTKDSKFWQFSFHEMGKYDMPAMIDYILNETKFKKIHYIGHSQGSVIFWILCHEHPEYNDKILSMQALGPVAYLTHCKSPVVKMMASNMNSLNTLTKMIGWNEFMPNKKFLGLFAKVFCKDGAVTQIVCENIIFLIVGFNDAKFDKSMLPVIGGHAPAGTSTRDLLHYGQLIKSGSFCQYDFGKSQNLKVYHQLTPPKYDLSKTKVKVVLHYSENDWMAQPKDVERLHKELPNVIASYLVADKNYNHLDFLWATDAKSMVYEKIFKILHLVEKGMI